LAFHIRIAGQFRLTYSVANLPNDARINIELDGQAIPLDAEPNPGVWLASVQL
jgi:hypothetical protein